MAKRNPYEGRCTICRAPVPALEGVVEPTGRWPWYRILCPEHMPKDALQPPKRPDASKLPSIHLDEDRFER